MHLNVCCQLKFLIEKNIHRTTTPTPKKYKAVILCIKIFFTTMLYLIIFRDNIFRDNRDNSPSCFSLSNIRQCPFLPSILGHEKVQ